jgi:nucleoid DNA-binding protein
VNKTELVSAVYNYLRDAEIKKPVTVPKSQFTITDDEGHVRHFAVRRRDKEVAYSPDDVKHVVNAMIEIVLDTMKHGESVYIPKIGTLHIHYREARKVRIPGTRQWKDVPAHYVPKVEFATALKESAKIYESYMIENGDPLFQPKEKRGRGRPRKHPLPESELQEGLEDEDIIEDADEEEDDTFYDDGICVDLELLDDGS